MKYQVVADYGQSYKLASENDELIAQTKTADRPCVGDWVETQQLADQVFISQICDRQTTFKRKIAGVEMTEQLLAVNFQAVLIFFPATKPLNLAYLERLVMAAWDSGAKPYIIISKADLAPTESMIKQVTQAFPGVTVRAISSQTGFGMAELLADFEATDVVLLVGASGVGKSSFVNYFAPDSAQTQAVRHDQKGRHTTSHRELIRTAQLGIIDTPGVREFGLSSSRAGLERLYHDIEQLSQACRFRDCQHQAEPGCAIQAALKQGTLSPERLNAYRKYDREIQYLATKLAQTSSLKRRRR